MAWLLIIIFAYFLLAISVLVDRYLLAGPLPNPKAYACLLGLLSGLALFLIPFVSGILLNQLLMSLLAGAVWIIALYLLYLAIFQSEVSRVVPAIGGLLPIFTFLLSFIFFPGQITISATYIFTLLLLVLGSILISFEKGKSINIKSFGLLALTGLTFALGFVLMKMVYVEQSFVSGFIWMRLGGFLVGLAFLVFPEARRIIKKPKTIVKKQVSFPIIFSQAVGGLGFILQNYAVNLAEVNQIAIINALEGTRYLFLLFLVFILGRHYPQLLKEETTGKAFYQKIIGVLIIGAGLALLVLSQ